MEKDLKTRLINRKIEKPNQFLMTVGLWIVGIINKIHKVHFEYDYDKKVLAGKPVILLSSHASRLEFLYSVYGFGRRDINVVCGYQNIIKKGLYPIFLKLGVISKYLYQPDFACVKNMFHVLRRNGAIGLFPEGIQSTSGSTHPINPATAMFIKKSKATIVVCKTQGAYLATNRYSSDRKKGYVGVSYSLLFTPEMLDALTEEQIYEKMMEKISYNDFEFNRTARNKYIGKKPNAYGIDKILYRCPKCKEEHALLVENDAIICEKCGFLARVDEYYDLIDKNGSAYPFSIDDWYKWQRRCVAEEIKDDSFSLNLVGSMCALKLDKLRKSPNDREILSRGKATLTNRSLSFSGELDGKEVNYDFPANSIYSITFSTKGFLEFYHNNDYLMIIPDGEEKNLIKWTLAAEEIHNLYDEKWKSASADVYDYSKGDIYG